MFSVTDGVPAHESVFEFAIIIYGNNTAPMLAQGAYSLNPQQQQQQQTSGLLFRAHDFSVGRAAGEYHQDPNPYTSGLIGNAGPHSQQQATASIPYIPDLTNLIVSEIETEADIPFVFDFSHNSDLNENNQIQVVTGGSNSTLNVMLEVSNGTLSVTNFQNLDSISGNNTSTILITGSPQNINFALNALEFTPDPGYHNNSGAMVDTLVVESWVDVDRELYFSFENIDDTTGDIVDDNAGTSNNGVLQGDATIRNDDHLAVSGAGGVEIAGGLGITDELTFATWLELPISSSGNRMDIISIDGFGSLYYDPSDEKVIGFFTEGGSEQNTSTDFNLNDGNRHHIAYTVDSNTNRQSLYIDGVLVEVTNHNHADNLLLDNPATSTTIIGSNGFSGKIDEVHIFSRALSSEEILAVHDDGDTGNPDFNNLYRTQDIDEVNIIIHPQVQGPTVISLGDTPLTFTENSQPVITTNDIIIEDEGGNDIQSAVVTVMRTSHPMVK